MRLKERGEQRRLRFEIKDTAYLNTVRYLRALYEQDRAKEQARMLAGTIGINPGHSGTGTSGAGRSR